MTQSASILLKQILLDYTPFTQAIKTAFCNNKCQIQGLSGALSGFFVARYAQENKNDTFVVTPLEKDALLLQQDIATFDKDIKVFIMPLWGSTAYRAATQNSFCFGERTAFFCELLNRTKKQDATRVFILPQRAFLSFLPPPQYEKNLCFMIKKGDSLDTGDFAQKLAALGYTRVQRVTQKGEFSIKGEVLDLFLAGNEKANRITLDFDVIDKIKTFDIQTQSSFTQDKKEVQDLVIYPKKEVIWSDDLIEKLHQVLETKALKDIDISFCSVAVAKKQEIIEELIQKGSTQGEELFYGSLWDRPYSIMDYLSEGSTVIYAQSDRLQNAQNYMTKEYVGMYQKAAREFPVLPPKDTLFDFFDMQRHTQKCIMLKSLSTQIGNADDIANGTNDIANNTDDTSGTKDVNDCVAPIASVASVASATTLAPKKENIATCVIPSQPEKTFLGNINYLKEEIKSYIQSQYTIFIFCQGEHQALRICSVLLEEKSDNLKISGDNISNGFALPGIKLLVIQENEIFGRKKKQPVFGRNAKSLPIDTFIDLKPGDYVVHVNYGIGLFRGIERQKAAGQERDYIKLEYSGGDSCFVPIEQVNLVQKYIGQEAGSVHLDTIGSKSWENRKNRVKKATEEMAQKLLDIYAKRKAARGFPFGKDTQWQAAFEAAFPYEDTPDQITVTKEIKQDMEKPQPMDRLLCGDVGYGKTEVALRAAFKAVMAGKQVAFLSPTTILAEQHFETATNRFASFPVNIAQLSRFVPQKEQKKTLEELKQGKVDILIGTHRIIQKDVIFKDLGLLIIDEEQRFGVKDKEKLKALKSNIDCLSMSATPIPRTLHMSMLKIRDMSLLTTPPVERKPIETIIAEYSEDKIAQAIRLETARGGQVFFLHNRVESLDEVRLKLQNLLPEMMIDVAHGQMSSDELDDIFRRFKMGGFQILISTTIIENGIDIPNVNTIIIDRADMYGVSQLYQLRGRVGRSERKAYAYLFYPRDKSLNETAMKRLEVISDFTQLGSGFKIAMKDLEIRGAGNILGKDQSGDVYAVGFDLYLKLLSEAVNRLSQENYQAQREVLLELDYSGFIPDSYILNAGQKMEIYKKIAAVSTKEELFSLRFELQDRFGPIPEQVENLLSLSQIRILCKNLGIDSLKEKMGVITATFFEIKNINIDKLLSLITKSNGKVSLNPKKPQELILKPGRLPLNQKGEFIKAQLGGL